MTALKLLADANRAGVFLSANEDRLAFDAPAGTMTPDLRALLLACKPELLAVLKGDYLSAALLLLAAQRDALAYLFDERAGICQYDGNMGREEAERQAYLALAQAVEESDGLDANAR